jgi:hypothetical protein
VLIALVERVYEILERQGFEVIDKHEWQFHTIPSLTNDQIWQRIYLAYSEWDKTSIYDGASYLMQRIWQDTATPIQVITARPPNSAVYTVMHLNKVMKGIPYMLAMVDSGDQKINYLDPDDILVEDRRKTCIDLSRAGVRTILIDKTYNQIENQEDRYPLITRIPDIGSLNPRHFI